MGCLDQYINSNKYEAVLLGYTQRNYSILASCKILGVTRSGYYKWLKRDSSPRMSENTRIAELIQKIYADRPDKGYRRIHDTLLRDYGTAVNEKRILRICRKLGLKSTVKYSRHSCTVNASNPQHIAENILNRDFKASKPNEKWLTDVTEFKWYEGIVVHKVYLSAILDLYDRRIVAYEIGDSNNNSLVYNNFNKAVTAYPDAHPIFHSDRGFQYTNQIFHKMLSAAGMTQSMSRVAHCIDNGPMEGFWGILKREAYYGHRFTSRDTLVNMIESYIDYYNSRRYQRNLGILTPMEKYYMAA